MLTRPDQNCRLSAHPLEISQTQGYLSSYITSSTNCGSFHAPWIIQASPGQRINLTLYDFSAAEIERENPNITTCVKYATLTGKLSTSTPLIPTSAFKVLCKCLLEKGISNTLKSNFEGSYTNLRWINYQQYFEWHLKLIAANLKWTLVFIQLICWESVGLLVYQQLLFEMEEPECTQTTNRIQFLPKLHV